jgi:AcrR family transcriptional regulator
VSPDQDDSERPRPPKGESEAEREALISAFSKAVAEQGYRALTLAAVARTAGVPQARFEAHFATKERGLIAAQEVFLDRLWLEVIAACEAPSEWPGKVSAGLGSAITTLTESSALARVFTVEATGVSLAAAERHFAALDQFASLLAEGRKRYPRADSLPAMAERTLIGGVASIAANSLLAEEPAALTVARPQLTELLLSPYLGEEEARQVAHP